MIRFIFICTVLISVLYLGFRDQPQVASWIARADQQVGKLGASDKLGKVRDSVNENLPTASEWRALKRDFHTLQARLAVLETRQTPAPETPLPAPAVTIPAVAQLAPNKGLISDAAGGKRDLYSLQERMTLFALRHQGE